ncbi:hypothetical protein PTKIN_Ptkin16aG0532300 [Pterospermum kingtungense]
MITGDPLGIMLSWNDSLHFFNCVVLNADQDIRELQLEALAVSGNSKGGEIPSNISACSKLTHLYISHNLLVGEIPASLGHLSNLKELSFENNSLRESVPPSLGNLSSLEIFWNLTEFSVGGNEMSGMIPSSLFNLSNIRGLDIGDNNFHGTLPSQLGVNMPYLEFFSVAKNQFSGPFPLSITNASNLIVLQLGENRFSGNMPSFRKLQQLRNLNIPSNFFGSCGANDLNFLYSLTNISNLELVDVSENSFEGTLPECISNLSTAITFFAVHRNDIVGTIPAGFGNLINL